MECNAAAVNVLFLPEIACQILSFISNEKFVQTLISLFRTSSHALMSINSQLSYVTKLLNDRDGMTCSSIQDLEFVTQYVGKKNGQKERKLILFHLNHLQEKHVSFINQFSNVSFDTCDIHYRMLFSITNPHNSQVKRLHFKNSEIVGGEPVKRAQPIRMTTSLRCISFENTQRGLNPIYALLDHLDIKSSQWKKVKFLSPIVHQDKLLIESMSNHLTSVQFLNQNELFVTPQCASNLQSITLPTLEHLQTRPAILKLGSLGRVSSNNPVLSVKKLVVRDVCKEGNDFISKTMKALTNKFPNCEELTLPAESLFKLEIDPTISILTGVNSIAKIKKINLVHSRNTEAYIYGSLKFALELMFPLADISLKDNANNKFAKFVDSNMIYHTSFTTVHNQVFNTIHSISSNPTTHNIPMTVVDQLKSDYCMGVMNVPKQHQELCRTIFVKLIDTINGLNSYKLAKLSVLERFRTMFETYAEIMGEDDLFSIGMETLNIAIEQINENPSDEAIYEAVQNKIGENLRLLSNIVEEMMQMAEMVNLPRKILQKSLWFSEDVVEEYGECF